jgi:hypothetical protein
VLTITFWRNPCCPKVLSGARWVQPPDLGSRRGPCSGTHATMVQGNGKQCGWAPTDCRHIGAPGDRNSSAWGGHADVCRGRVRSVSSARAHHQKRGVTRRDPGGSGRREPHLRRSNGWASSGVSAGQVPSRRAGAPGATTERGRRRQRRRIVKR